MGWQGDSDRYVHCLTTIYICIISPSNGFNILSLTGPKGVIEDWRRYKQLETETRERDKQEKDELCRKLAMTCKSFREENENSKSEEEISDDDEQFMEWYKQKRILEIQQKYASRWEKVAFGDVIELDQSNFIEAVENVEEFVTVIIHVYDDDTPACATVNGCMKILASKYKTVKFCKIDVKVAKMSSNFIENGLPTIIVYKGNLLIGNYVRISDSLGEDFFAPDLEEFLSGYGVLPSKHEIPHNT